MKNFAMFLALLLCCSGQAMALDKDGKPVNPVEAAYQSAKPAKPDVPLKDGETLQARAEAWEAFAAKEAHEHSTVIGLKGQGKDSPNCRECEGWAWLNAGTAWYRYAEQVRKNKATDKKWLSDEVRDAYVAALKKATECYGKCADTAGVTDGAKEMASNSKTNIEELVSKLSKSG